MQRSGIWSWDLLLKKNTDPWQIYIVKPLIVSLVKDFVIEYSLQSVYSLCFTKGLIALTLISLDQGKVTIWFWSKLGIYVSSQRFSLLLNLKLFHAVPVHSLKWMLQTFCFGGNFVFSFKGMIQDFVQQFLHSWRKKKLKWRRNVDGTR